MPPTSFGFILSSLMVLVILPACTKSCSKSPSSEPLSINIAVGSPIETIDPRYATSAVASRASKLVYAPLFDLGVDSSPEPFLAQSIESLDEKTFKLTLRQGLSFHDGSKLNAEDVVYTYSQLGQADVVSPHADKFSEYIKNIRAVGEYEVIFELKQTHAPFLTDLCALGIVSKKSCEGRSQACRHEHNGSGPFRVKNWDSAKEVLHLTPFANWYEGAPKNDVLLRVVRDENTRLLELIGQKTDLVESDISPQNIAELKKHPFLHIQEIAGLGYTYLAFNVRGPRSDDPKNSPQYLTRAALANKKVRQAIAHAIDIDQIIDKLLLGSAKRVSGLVPNGHWAKDPELQAPGYNTKIAEDLLDEAGFKRIGPKNNRFNLVIATTPNRLRQSIAQLYADFLARVGIDTTVRVKEWGALYQDMKQGNFEMFSAVWVPVTEPDLYYFVHHSKSIPENNDAGGNRHGYSNPEVDRLIEEGRTTMAPEKRKAIYQQIERIMIDELPYIPLWNENRIIVYNSDRLQGFEALPSGSLLGIRKAYIKGSQGKKAGS